MDEKNYEINIEQIKIDFKFKENGGLTNTQGNKYFLFPFVANEKNLFTDFSGVSGEFSRMICDKKLVEEFKVEKFIENMIDKIDEYEGEDSKQTLRDIINTMFISEGKLENFNIKTINYISSTNSDKKVAEYIYCNLFSESLKDIVKENYTKEEENLLYKLVSESLPELQEKKSESSKGINYINFVKELFIKDFKFLISNEELYKSSLKRFLEYYYIFYTSQIILKLSKFETADLQSPDALYYTLNWESVSKNRTAYKFGWELLKPKSNFIFAHAITLEMLNYHNLDRKLSYNDLFKIFKENDSKENNIKEQLNELINVYKEHLSVNEDELKYKKSENEIFSLVYKLFAIVEYQFNKGRGRARANQAYSKWFIKFVEVNFGKRRGALGYTLNLNEEDIILITKLCINNNEKIKLNTLFEEFKKRGICFDRNSSNKIVQLYEKLNLLEKKSDSGDAQYVRAIL